MRGTEFYDADGSAMVDLRCDAGRVLHAVVPLLVLDVIAPTTATVPAGR